MIPNPLPQVDGWMRSIRREPVGRPRAATGAETSAPAPGAGRTMRELIERALERWRRASRSEASPAERREALAVIPELCTALEQAGRSAGRPARSTASAVDERFARHVAHEVRNRLNQVEIALARLESTGAVEGGSTTLEPVRNGLRNLAATVEDLGGIDDAERPGVLGDGSTAPLSSLIRSLASACASAAGERGIVLEVEDDLPAVSVHAARCELALVNLLSNALDGADPAKPERWIRVEVRAEPSDDGARWRVGVVDNGVGIPPDLVDRVFEDTFSNGGDGEGGTGVGLTVAREAVEREGGRIWLESEEGMGTAVYFTVPERGDGRS